MNDNQAQTESILDIIKGVDGRTLMLPEFQRDFRWEMERTYDLFDSLVKEIFIGTLIYGKPSFGMTLREIDTRARKGKLHNTKLKTHVYSAKDMEVQSKTKNLRIVLDGQQRITAMFRAVTGVDKVYFIVRELTGVPEPHKLGLEALLEEFSGDDRADAISVLLEDAYRAEIEDWDEERIDDRFTGSAFARKHLEELDSEQRTRYVRIYRRTMKRLADFYKQEKMVAFYLLDMSLEKFCLFFERSNSRGIQLNFIDILAAKLYEGFNLRRKIEDFETQTRLTLNREVIVRAIAYIRAVEQGGQIKIDRSYILQHLEASDFQRLWDEVCTLYASVLHYLDLQHYILSQDWMPSENMLIPLVIFLREIGGGFDRMNEEQRRFIEFWYWSSVFANRYSTATNEVIINDSAALTQVAKGLPITQRGYFRRLRSVVTEPADLYSYTRRASLTYRGVLNLLAYAAGGLHDWMSTHRISIKASVLDGQGKVSVLDDHHIYPRAYIASRPELDVDNDEAEQLVDCVANRTLIPKLLNITIGRRAPHDYLSELRTTNPQLATCLESHLVPEELLSDPSWNGFFGVFLEERARRIYELIEHYAIEPLTEMASKHGAQSEIEDTGPSTNLSPWDTIIVPAKKEGFEQVFLGEQCWYAIRISGGMLDKIKYIAAYQSQPVSAITHYAPVARIEPYGADGKYKVVFSEPARPIEPIAFGDAMSGSMQGPRFTTYEKLLVAKKLSDLIGKA